jgi:hypothetical protein
LFLRRLGAYSGWLVVEQDWVPKPGENAEVQIRAQARNRKWLATAAGFATA